MSKFLVPLLKKIVPKSMPDGLDSTMLSNVMNQWKEFWTYPAMFAGVIAVVFFLTFWDKVSVAEEEGGE